jgi:hypothetical protein
MLTKNDLIYLNAVPTCGRDNLDLLVIDEDRIYTANCHMIKEIHVKKLKNVKFVLSRDDLKLVIKNMLKGDFVCFNGNTLLIYDKFHRQKNISFSLSDTPDLLPDLSRITEQIKHHEVQINHIGLSIPTMVAAFKGITHSDYSKIYVRKGSQESTPLMLVFPDLDGKQYITYVMPIITANLDF